MDLTDALRLGPREVVALVGGGGKTTAMHRLCLEAVARGRLAIASGTARFTVPAGAGRVPLLVEEDEGRLLAITSEWLRLAPWLIAASGRGSRGRLLPISYAAVEALAAHPGLGLLALEADGSGLRPFKAPAEHEPAVPPAATLVVAMAGAEIFGRPLSEEGVHRPERVVALTGVEPGALVTPEIVAAVLADSQGGRKGVPATARFAVLINKVTASRRDAARAAASALLGRGVTLVALAQVRESDPVVEVITA